MLDVKALVEIFGFRGRGYKCGGLGQLAGLGVGAQGRAVLVLLRDVELASVVSRILLGPVRLIMRVENEAGLGSEVLLHWAVVERISGSEIVLLDPFFGRVGWSRTRFEEMWSGYALVASRARVAGAGGSGCH